MMEHIGYFMEYYSNGKFIGGHRCDDMQNPALGYANKVTHRATEKITFGKKSIKAGELYSTCIIPLSGRIKNAPIA